MRENNKHFIDEKTSALIINLLGEQIIRQNIELARIEKDFERHKTNIRTERYNAVTHSEERLREGWQTEVDKLLNVIATNNFSTLKGDELRDILERRKLSTKGRNHELIKRIEEDNLSESYIGL
jgi:hypothetical protein